MMQEVRPKIGQRYKNTGHVNILVEVVEIESQVKFLVLRTSDSAFKIGERFVSGSLRPDGRSTGEWLYCK